MGDNSDLESRQAVDRGVPDDAWRTVSPLSPLLNTWSAIVVVLSVVIFRNLDLLNDPFWRGLLDRGRLEIIVLSVLGGLLVLLACIALYCWLAWRRMSFAVTDQAVWYRSGIVFRHQRHARLERIQAVDLVFPLIGRLLGIGKISIEVAGSAGSSLAFGFLRRPQLEDLRAEILARAAGIPVGQTEPDGARSDHLAQGAGAPVRRRLAADATAPERELYRVEPGQLFVSLLLNLGVVTALVLMLAFLVSLVAAYVYTNADLWSLLAAVPGILGIASVVWTRFAGEFGFRAAVSPDGIRVRRGLLETRAQTIPPRRVHAIEISQPFLWRKLGWYRVTIDQAGYGGEQKSAAGDVLLPVGSREQAMLALWLVLPDLGVEDPQSFTEAALFGQGPEQGFTRNPSRSRIFDPLVYRRRALAITDTCLVTRDGRIRHSTVFMPHERVQSLGLKQGPWERRRGLANLHFHTVPGPVTVRLVHADADEVGALLAEAIARGAQRRENEPPERWMRRVETELAKDGPSDVASDAEETGHEAGEEEPR